MLASILTPLPPLYQFLSSPPPSSPRSSAVQSTQRFRFFWLVDGVFLRDYHCERMIESAKALAPFANDQDKFLSELIPTPSEISTKLDAAIANAGKNARQRVS